MTEPLIDKRVDGINLHPLRAPAERTVGRRVAAPDDVDPEGLFRGRFQEINVEVEIVLLRAFVIFQI